MTKIIKADGTERTITGQGPHGQFTLKQLQEAVGGLVEVVFPVMLVNEEGRPRRLPFNPRASAIAGRQILGDVVVFEDQAALTKWLDADEGEGEPV